MIYRAVIALRNRLYDRQIFPVQKLPVPVVSVGNIAVGGTGKSPMTMALLDWAEKEKLKAGVISRGYGREHSGVAAVDLTVGDATTQFGDEPCMIKQRFPQVPIYVGPKRFDVGQKLLQHYKVDLIIADDAFQHRGLHRDLDIVMLDATQPNLKDKLLPFGKGREAFSSLKRAQVIILNTKDFAPREAVQTLSDRVRVETDSAIIVIAGYEFSGCRSVQGIELKQGHRVFAFSGLAQPDSFLALMRNNFSLVGKKSFADHHAYSDDDIARVCVDAKKHGVGDLVTTRKDAVKLGAAHLATIKKQNMQLWICDIQMSFSDEFNEVKGRLRELAR